VYVLRFGLALRELPAGPRVAIKRYRQIFGFPGDPDYLLTKALRIRESWYLAL
jgi:hypothetical protein